MSRKRPQKSDVGLSAEVRHRHSVWRRILSPGFNTVILHQGIASGSTGITTSSTRIFDHRARSIQSQSQVSFLPPSPNRMRCQGWDLPNDYRLVCDPPSARFIAASARRYDIGVLPGPPSAPRRAYRRR